MINSTPPPQHMKLQRGVNIYLVPMVLLHDLGTFSEYTSRPCVKWSVQVMIFIATKEPGCTDKVKYDKCQVERNQGGGGGGKKRMGFKIVCIYHEFSANFDQKSQGV